MVPILAGASEFTFMHVAGLSPQVADCAATHTVPLNAVLGKFTVPVVPVPVTVAPGIVVVHTYPVAPDTAIAL